jgi:predicted ArsR family transcriptional regulator
MMGITIEQLSETRQSILLAIKRKGQITILELASELKMTREAVRLQLLQLENEGWIEKKTRRGSGYDGGRPSMYYSLTPEGEHLFPKHYDLLTVEVLDTVAAQLGTEAFHQILATMTKARIREWEPRLQGLNLEQRIEALKAIYLNEDAYMEVDASNNRLRLVERNCPFLNVAKRRPILCNVTVSMLTHLLGYRVVREESFQQGDGKCAFRVMLDQPVNKSTPQFIVEA